MSTSPLYATTSQVTEAPLVQSKKFGPLDGKCALKRFDIATFDNQFFKPAQHNRHTMLAASWETTDDECVEDYGVVQYIKGCIYNSSYDPKTKEVEKHFGYVRESRGESILFQHKTWEVDSIDADPLYASYYDDTYSDSERFNWHKIVANPLFSFDTLPESISSNTFFDRKNYVVNVKAKEKGETTNRLFVTDLPSGSDYRQNGALGKDWIATSSLEFKTCLYHKKDIPSSGDPKDFNEPEENGGPIHCFDWSDKTKPNYETKRLERTDESDPFCFQD